MRVLILVVAEHRDGHGRLAERSVGGAAVRAADGDQPQDAEAVARAAAALQRGHPTEGGGGVRAGRREAPGGWRYAPVRTGPAGAAWAAAEADDEGDRERLYAEAEGHLRVGFVTALRVDRDTGNAAPAGRIARLRELCFCHSAAVSFFCRA